tara:strand:- start:1126 stop:2064 length:939 start_codon:yes stop_codon:yes gene_type:complete
MVLNQIKIYKILKVYSGLFTGAKVIMFVLVLNSCNSNNTITSDLLKGEDFLSEGNIDSAQFYYYKILELDSNNSIAINQLAEIHFRRVEIGKALTFFNKSISLDSTNEEAYFKVAEIKLFLGDYKSVFININKGLRVNDRRPEAYFMKGVAYKHIGDTTKSISSFKTAIELEHDFAEVYYELGLLLTLQNDSQAIDYYKRGIEISPEDAGLKYSLAWSYDQFEKQKDADKMYAIVLKQYPSFIQAKSNYAIFKYKLNQIDTALLLCNEVLKDDSLNYSTLNLKGTILKEKGMLNELQKIKDKLFLIDSELKF